MDPDIDFAGTQSQFDTFLIGRKTFEAMVKMGSDGQSLPGIQNIVLSRTLKASDYPHITVESDAERVVARAPGKAGQGHRDFRRRGAFSEPACGGPRRSDRGGRHSRPARRRHSDFAIARRSGAAQAA